MGNAAHGSDQWKGDSKESICNQCNIAPSITDDVYSSFLTPYEPENDFSATPGNFSGVWEPHQQDECKTDSEFAEWFKRQFPADGSATVSRGQVNHCNRPNDVNLWVGNWDSAHRDFGTLETEKCEMLEGCNEFASNDIIPGGFAAKQGFDTSSKHVVGHGAREMLWIPGEERPRLR
eukprot:TRINITY_DN33558_c0_g1_i1.p1 TRINITY_DN33558_c0_g1~~TRINITY_DN33558_c0_g1_i1.p1  ORF type:complete len:177 (+),score=25.57 TRINITY_DN33558_c0_g1_i1:170-700(+)